MPKNQVNESVVDSLVVDFSRHQRRFILSPKQWSKFQLATKLVWKHEALLESNISAIPKSRGLYAHSICLNLPSIPENGYITYVGIVGDKKNKGISGNSRHLQQRFKEYLREQKKLIRGSVWEVLKEYADHMVFHYAEIPDNNVRLLPIENALLDTLLPPCNEEDFTLEVKKAYQIVTKK